MSASEPAAPAAFEASPMEGRADLEALEAAVLRRLVAHLRARPEVQNIDLMNLAGFCRNCLSNWLEDAARETAEPITRDAARRHVYGMSYDAWKSRHQAEASADQQAAFAAQIKAHG